MSPTQGRAGSCWQGYLRLNVGAVVGELSYAGVDWLLRVAAAPTSV